MALVIIGKLGPAVQGATPQFDAADLIEMADAESASHSGGVVSTAPDGDLPALIEAPRVTRPENGESDGSAEGAPVTEAAIDGGTAVAGPTASLGNNSTDDGAVLTPLVDDPAADAVPANPTDPQARGEAALETISYPWQQLLPGWTIEFLPEKGGLYGLTLVPEKRIEVYVRDSQTEALLAHVIAHELGHAVDVTLNDGPDRRAWAEARGTGSSPWWPGNGTTDFSTGAGDFAESFAAWQVGSGSFRSTLAEPPTQAQIELLAKLAAG